MSKEKRQPPAEGFDLTKNERLYDRIPDSRFKALIFHPQSTIHEVKIDSNNYGEFLFMTASRAKGNSREVLTFWGLGLHEYRDRIIQEEWFYYRSHPVPDKMKQQISADEVQSLISERRREIAQDKQDGQSSMGALFELIADLTDDDGALAELDDLRSLGFLLNDDE